MDQLLFTPAGLLDLLSQIDELKDKDVGVTETLDNKLQLTVGSSTYILDTSDAVDVSVSPRTIEDVEAVNEEAYEQLEASGTVELQTPVQSGILKELAKTLLVGGLVRLTKKLLTK